MYFVCELHALESVRRLLIYRKLGIPSAMSQGQTSAQTGIRIHNSTDYIGLETGFFLKNCG